MQELIFFLLTFITTVALFLVFPGPVNVVVVTAGLQNGMRGAFWSLAGANAASLVLIGVAGCLVYGAYQIDPKVFECVSVLGGGYFLFYAFGQSRDLLKKSTSAEPANNLKPLQSASVKAEAAQKTEIVLMYSEIFEQLPTQSQVDCGSFNLDINDIKGKHSNLWLFSKGFGIGISNPKDVIFFMSFFPPFVNQLMLKAEIDFISSLIGLTLIWTVLDYSILLSYAKVFQKLINEKVAKYIAWMGVFLFVCLGAWAVLGGIHALMMSK